MILILAIIFLSIDWSRGETSFSTILKYILSCFCVTLVWTTGKDGLDARDTTLLRIAFGFTLIADTFLVLLDGFANPGKHSYFFIAGVCYFAGFHIFLILRHSRHIRELLHKLKKRQLVFFTSIALGIVVLSLIKLFVFYPLLKDTLVTIALILYGIILAASVFVSWTTLHDKFYSKQGAWLIAISVTLLFISDFCIILAGIDNPGKLIAKQLIWTLYAPALVGIGLSGFRRGNQ